MSVANDLGLKFKIVKADSGAIGGDVSEEFHILAENGEDTIAVSDSSDFAINTELLLKEGMKMGLKPKINEEKI